MLPLVCSLDPPEHQVKVCYISVGCKHCLANTWSTQQMPWVQIWADTATFLDLQEREGGVT